MAKLSDSEDHLRNDAFLSAVESYGEPIVSNSSDEDTDDGVTDWDVNDDCVQDLLGKDGYSWPNFSLFKHKEGIAITKRCKHQVWFNRVYNKPSSSFRLLFSEAMRQNLQKCTVSEAHGLTENINWNVTLHELDKFIGLIITRDVVGQRILACFSLWNTS